MAEAAKKKKKLLRVKGYPNTSSGYSTSSMMFSLANIIDGERQQVLAAYTCREQLCAAIKNVVQGESDNHGLSLDFDRTRLLIIQDPSNFSVFRDKLFTGKALANTFEKAAGWEPLSKITTVKHSVYKNAWLLTGPGEWMSQPQLMSALTFLLRLASNHGPFDASNLEETEAAMKKLLKTDTKKTSDSTYFLPHIWDSLRLVTVNHKEIFGGISVKKAWCDDQGSSFGYASGILNFVTNDPSYSKGVVAAKRRFKELREKK